MFCRQQRADSLSFRLKVDKYITFSSQQPTGSLPLLPTHLLLLPIAPSPFLLPPFALRFLPSSAFRLAPLPLFPLPPMPSSPSPFSFPSLFTSPLRLSLTPPASSTCTSGHHTSAAGQSCAGQTRQGRGRQARQADKASEVWSQGSGRGCGRNEIRLWVQGEEGQAGASQLGAGADRAGTQQGRGGHLL